MVHLDIIGPQFYSKCVQVLQETFNFVQFIAFQLALNLSERDSLRDIVKIGFDIKSRTHLISKASTKHAGEHD